MAYSSSWKRGQVSSGWSRYPKEENDINVQMKNIAEYNLGPVGYQDPNAVSKIFTGTGAIFKTRTISKTVDVETKTGILIVTHQKED